MGCELLKAGTNTALLAYGYPVFATQDGSCDLQCYVLKVMLLVVTSIILSRGLFAQAFELGIFFAAGGRMAVTSHLKG